MQMPNESDFFLIFLQVRGTIFNELDEDKLFTVIDFVDFEERFKIAASGRPFMNGASEIDGLATFPSKRFKKPDMVSLLEHTRLRNIGEIINRIIIYWFVRLRLSICIVCVIKKSIFLCVFVAISRRKIELPIEKVIAGVNALDLKQVSLENVEILQRMIPTDQEVSKYYFFNHAKHSIFVRIGKYIF